MIKLTDEIENIVKRYSKDTDTAYIYDNLIKRSFEYPALKKEKMNINTFRCILCSVCIIFNSVNLFHTTDIFIKAFSVFCITMLFYILLRSIVNIFVSTNLNTSIYNINLSIKNILRLSQGIVMDKYDNIDRVNNCIKYLDTSVVSTVNFMYSDTNTVKGFILFDFYRDVFHNHIKDYDKFVEIKYKLEYLYCIPLSIFVALLITEDFDILIIIMILLVSFLISLHAISIEIYSNFKNNINDYEKFRVLYNNTYGLFLFNKEDLDSIEFPCYNEDDFKKYEEIE